MTKVLKKIGKFLASKPFAIGLLVACAVLIFTMSSFPAAESTGQSDHFVIQLQGILHLNNADHDTLLSLTRVVRKAAHFIEYFILGLAAINAFRMIAPEKWRKYYYVAIIACVLYAITDELHQLLIPGRSCELTDMLIDGVASGIAIIIVHAAVERASKFFDF